MTEDEYQDWLKVMDSSCDAMIASADALKRRDLKPDQRQKLHQQLVERSLKLKTSN